MTYGFGLKGRFNALLEFATALIGWVVVAPFTWLVPRNAKLMLFFGRDSGKYIDNCKHLYAAMSARTDSAFRPVYLAKDTALRDQLRALGGEAELLRSVKGAMLWLTAGTICVDSIDWMRGMRYAGARGARVVQMWHGIPLKRVQLARIKARTRQPLLKRAAFNLYLRVIGRYATTAWFLSTSRHVTERAFSASFLYRQVSHAGYPRTDVLFKTGSALAEFGIDIRAAAAVAAHRSSNPQGLVGIYAPTFRESLEDPFANGTVDLNVLSASAAELGMLLLVKLHPWMHDRVKSGDLRNVVFVAPDSDVYPLLRSTDFLITDYSSIFFDYLLLDRPVLFFPYDLEHYLANERSMYFDYSEMTPGSQSMSLTALTQALKDLAAGKDDWKAHRAEVRSKVFDHTDGRASERLINELESDIGG